MLDSVREEVFLPNPHKSWLPRLSKEVAALDEFFDYLLWNRKMGKNGNGMCRF